MKTFKELSEKQKAIAVDYEVSLFLRAVAEGGLRFDDKRNKDNLQKRIDAAVNHACEIMLTPWFAGEYIMDTCKEEIEAMARAQAEEALYPDPGEIISEAVIHEEAA